MAENKYISELSDNLTPSLTGYTVYDNGLSTYKVSLQTLKDTLGINGDNQTYTPIEYFNDLTSSVNNLIANTGSYLTSLPENVVSGSSQIIYSGITGVPDNLISGSSQIEDLGFAITGSNLFLGDQTIRGTVVIGTGSLHGGNPEVLSVANSGSFNIAYFTGKSDTYAQINIQNVSNNSGASTDLVLTADNGSETNHYVNLGINSSGWMYQTSSIGYQNDAYLYNVGQDMYIGTMEPASPDHGHLHLFSSNSWNNPQITIFSEKTIAFNTGSVTTGYTYEFSGSVKINNTINTTNITSDTNLNLVTSGNNVNILGSNLMIPNGGLFTSYDFSTSGSATIGGLLKIKSVTEDIQQDGEFNGNRNFNFVSGSIFYLSALGGNGEYNIYDVPEVESKAVTITFVIEQGSTPYSGSAYYINGSQVDVKWVDGSIPTGSANKTEVIGLTAFRVNSSWNVLGSLSTFG